LAFAWLVARAEIQQVRQFQSTRAEVDAMAHCQIGDALALQHQTAQAMTHFSEAVRRAERACELTGYREPLPLGTLACAYAGAGRFNDAFATASKGRDRALASGQNELAGSLLKLMEYYPKFHGCEVVFTFFRLWCDVSR
jgi:Flp pilus assembly protein TadD